jgi:hypothetical protein
MKRVFKLSAIVALLFATNVTLGAEPKVNVDEVRKTIIIEFEKPRSENQLRLIDLENNVIYFERFNKFEIHTKKLDLNKLPTGSYVMKLENDLRIAEYGISVEKSGVHIISKKIDNKPVFSKRAGRVFLNLLNSDLGPVDISVRDAVDRLLFSETIDRKLVVEKAFNFNGAFKGGYTIKVKVGDGVYFEEISVK